MDKGRDGNVLAWLLERDNPAVRARALVDLLDRPEGAPEVVEARTDTMRSGVVPTILAKQAPGGHWGKAEDFYVRAKYKGTVWQLVVLAELGGVAQSRWLEFGFPLMWDTDVLEMLEVLSELGYRDERMEEAVDLVASKRDADGRWRMERSFNGRMLTNIERRHRPSKWITLRALSVLKRFGRWPEDASAKGRA